MDNVMEKLIIDDSLDLAMQMYVEAQEGNAPTAVLYYTKVGEVLKWLLEMDDVKLGMIDISDDYIGEYYVQLNKIAFDGIEDISDAVYFLDIGKVRDCRDRIKTIDYVLGETKLIFIDGNMPNSISLMNQKQGVKQIELSFDEIEFEAEETGSFTEVDDDFDYGYDEGATLKIENRDDGTISIQGKGLPSLIEVLQIIDAIISLDDDEEE